MSVLELPKHYEEALAAKQVSQVGGFRGSNGISYVTSMVTNPQEMQPITSQWQALGRQSAEPNPFYEPWFFLPAVRHLAQSEQWRILLVHRISAQRPATPELCGFFPFVQSRGPALTSQLSLWKNQFCFLTNPLIHQDRPGDILRAAIQHLREIDADVACLEFATLSGEGPIHHGLTEILREHLTTTYLPDQYLRATTHCDGDAEQYLKNALGGHHFREYRRQRRKLEALGQLEFRQLQDPRGLNGWLDWFLDLEARGWKARAGTAIQQHGHESIFFREMAEGGLLQGSLGMEGLFLNGEPIAMKCVLKSPPAAFAFKIAFDETHRKYSPGVLLEFESLQRMADDESIQWCDSCAVPGHQMIDRLWTERRMVQHLLISTGHGYGDVVIGSLPLFRSLNRVRKRWVEDFKQRLTRSQPPEKS